jgi:dienelactone hydrolase
MMTLNVEHIAARIRLKGGEIAADICVPQNATGLVVITGQPGSGRESALNLRLAELLQECGFATALADLPQPEARHINYRTGESCGELDPPEEQVVALTDWLRMQEHLRHLPLGYFGDGLGAECALVAASKRPEVIRAVVCCGARPARIASSLVAMRTPALFITGGEDMVVLARRMAKLGQLPRDTVRKWQTIGTGPNPLGDPQLVESVGRAACEWYQRFLA